MLELNTVKQDLRVTEDDDNGLITRLIQSAESECVQFLGMDELPVLNSETGETDIPPAIAQGIMLIVRADYDAVKPEDRAAWRKAAETLWMPWRIGLGV